ncbi:hypothetical protein ACQ4PT_042305 [Festuca glaucescens]
MAAFGSMLASAVIKMVVQELSSTIGTVRLWLERLKKAMYDISDMINDFETSTEVPAGQKIPVISHCL